MSREVLTDTIPPQDRLSTMRELRASDDPIGYIERKGLSLPRSVGLIADGNGRWATQRGLPYTEGHKEGAKRVIELLRSCRRLPIETVAVWAMSPANLKFREEAEIQGLMDLTVLHVNGLLAELMEANAQFLHLGSKEGLPKNVVETLTNAEEATALNTGQRIALAFNFDGDQEEEDTAITIYNAGTDGRLVSPTRQAMRHLIDSSRKIPGIDLLVRTGGEERLSGIGRIADHAQIYFVKPLMPDFTTKHLAMLFVRYAFQERRHGARPTPYRIE